MHRQQKRRIDPHVVNAATNDLVESFGAHRRPCEQRLVAILKADTRANSEAGSKIPYATEQGIILEEQGNLAQEQGISAAKARIIAG
jgi:hypothetical protein